MMQHLPVRGGKYEHIQAQEAKEHHGRPQDKDAPDFSRLNKGERVSFQTHSHAGIGIVGAQQPECAVGLCLLARACLSTSKLASTVRQQPPPPASVLPQKSQAMR